MTDESTTESDQQPASTSAKGFSLLTLVLMATIAAIGMSHVQTTYKLQKLQQKYDRLLELDPETLNTEVSDD